MEVKCERLAPLVDRVKAIPPVGNSIYSYIEEERVKAYLPFTHQFVSNLLTKRKVSEWNTGGYFIASQTGSGKSTLIKEVIAPVAIDRGARVLLIVPRVALAMQYKRELALEYCPQVLEELKDPGINKRSSWGPVDVYSLQSLGNGGKREEILKKCSSYDFVLLDEVQAYTVDATFNPLTEEIFRFLICQVGKSCKRVYLTATPDIILEEVAQMEAEVLGRPLPERNLKGDFKEEVYLTLFQFQFDYHYLVPNFFEKEETLFQRLKEISVDEKAVIFVRSKSQGLRLQEKLGGRERAIYMDAANKNATEEEAFSELITENSFKQQFLIATRFLDVGVNLKDFNIKHVAIFHRFKEDVVQMLGRKRIMSKDVVNLYVEVPKYTKLLSEIEQLQESYKELQRVKSRCQYQDSWWYDELPLPLFLCKNKGKQEIRYSMFCFYINKYHTKQLHDYIRGCENEWEYYKKFVQTVLSWFPGHKEAIDLEKAGKNILPLKGEIECFLEPYADKELTREETLGLSNQLLKLMKVDRRPAERESISLANIRNFFQKSGIAYGIYNQSRKGRKGLWVVRKGVWQK
ncbi:MAG: DEAD/DEAH box helicase family protein [Hungatella sp.]|jgi:hypothetical protein|nr:DEAD/DEAH box helicase family protein [Hungatella sp.]